MRNNQWIAWTLLATVAGCVGPGSPGPLQMSQHPQHTQLAAGQMAPQNAQQSSGFTQRFADAILPGHSNPARKAQQQAAAASAARQQRDPISLGFASGAPNAELYLSMAKLSDRGGNAAHARSMYQRVLASDANNLEALLGLARLEDREGNLDEAIRIYQQAATVHPRDGKTLNDLALCYARSGKLPASFNLLQQAIRMQPDKQLYRNNIAKVLVELNRIDEAVGNLAAVHPPAIAQYNMGVLLHQRGRSSEAMQYLTAATQIDPSLQQASALLTEISGEPTQMVERPPASNDHILPTPMIPPNTGGQAAVVQPYPSTGVPQVVPTYQPVPAETAQRPLGNSPVLLPPVR